MALAARARQMGNKLFMNGVIDQVWGRVGERSMWRSQRGAAMCLHLSSAGLKWGYATFCLCCREPAGRWRQLWRSMVKPA
jgi:hypothetical protein